MAQKNRRRRASRQEETESPTRLPLSNEVRAAISAYAEEGAIAFDLELWSAEVSAHGGRWHVVIMLDRPGLVAVPGESVTVEQCARVSRFVEALMDADERIPEAYALEVGSPGIERKVSTVEQFRKVIGHPARVVTREPVDGLNTFHGEVLAVGVEADGEVRDPEGDGASDEEVLIVVQLDEADSVQIPFGVIKKAHLTFDFDAYQERNS